MIHTWFKDCCQNCPKICVNQDTFEGKTNVEIVVYCERYPFCREFTRDEGNKILRPIGFLMEKMNANP